MPVTIDEVARELAEREAPHMEREAPQPPTDSHRAYRWLALLAGNGLDAASTEVALRRPGTMEANPVMRGGTGARLALKGGSAALEGFLLDKIAKEHPKVANVMGAGIGGALGMIGARNLKQGR